MSDDEYEHRETALMDMPGTRYKLRLSWQQPTDPDGRPAAVDFEIHQTIQRDLREMVELAAKGYFRFDGCSYLSHVGSSLHTCKGRRGLVDFFDVVAVAFDRATAIMQELDEGAWDVRGDANVRRSAAEGRR